MNKTKGIIIGGVEIISLCVIIILSLAFFPPDFIETNFSYNVDGDVVALDLGAFDLDGLTLRDSTVLTTTSDKSIMSMNFEKSLLFDAVVIDVKEMSVESTLCKIWFTSKDQIEEEECVITELKSGINVIFVPEKTEKLEAICINIAEKEGVVININSLGVEVKMDEKA